MAVNDQIVNEKYALYNGDCVEVVESLPDEWSDAIDRYIVRCRQEWQAQKNIADGIAKEIAVTTKAPINKKANDENKLHNGKMAFTTKERKANRIRALERSLPRPLDAPSFIGFAHRKKPVVGDIGTPPSGYFFTVQITSPSTAIVKIGFDIALISGGYDREHHPLYIIGLDTGDWSDNQRIEYDRPLYVSGTHSYTTALGAKATIPKCEPLTDDEVARIRKAFLGATLIAK